MLQELKILLNEIWTTSTFDSFDEIVARSWKVALTPQMKSIVTDDGMGIYEQQSDQTTKKKTMGLSCRDNFDFIGLDS